MNDIDLHDVLADPSSLAYWLEYMDRRKRSRLVQFWLTVEGFKDPLEGDSLGGPILASGAYPAYSGETAAEDIAFLHESYVVESGTSLNIPTRHVRTIGDLVKIPPPLQGADILRARQAIFAAQQAVYDQMAEEDWPGFTKSELFVKACADLSRSAISMPRSPLPLASPTLPQPHLMTSPPPLPQRSQSTSGIIRRTSAETGPPMTPTLGHSSMFSSGLFSPKSTSATPATTLDTATVFDSRPSAIRQHSHGSNEFSASPTAERRNLHLDFLIGQDDDEGAPRTREKLFADQDDDDVDGIPEVQDDPIQIQRMEAIQAALNEIIASDGVTSSLNLGRSEDRPNPVAEPEVSMTSSLVLQQKPASVEPLGKLVSRSVGDLRSLGPKRSTPSASTSTPTSRTPSDTQTHRRTSAPDITTEPKTLFEDDLHGDDGDIGDSEETEPLEDQGLLRLASPGDMHLGPEIARLESKLLALAEQEQLLQSLIGQAELTGNTNELKILNRSLSSVRREQRTAAFQKTQYQQQEEENKLVPGKTRVSISSADIVNDHGEVGSKFVRYTIQVRQGSGSEVSSWEVARRYNAFWELDKALREWARATGQSYLLQGVEELPPKRLVPNLSSNFIQTRRQGLERYLQVSLRLNDPSLILISVSHQFRPNLPNGTTARLPLSFRELQPHRPGCQLQHRPRSIQ